MIAFFLHFTIGDVYISSTNSIATIEGDGEITQELIRSYSYETWTQVIIQHGPESIGPSSFTGCSAVSYLYISDSVKIIDFAEGRTFRAMKSLAKINVAANNNLYSNDDQGILYNKEKSILYRAPNIENINIPSTVNVLFYQCFQANSKIKSLIIPNSVNEIKSGFIYDIRHSPDNITFQKGSTISYFSGDTFSYQNFKLVVVPKSVKTLHSSAFSFASILDIQFEEGSLLESINNDCFSQGSFQEITFPNNLKSINERSFSSCNSLHTIRIPRSTSFIHQDAFSGCTSLSTIIVDDNNTNYKVFEGSLFSKDMKTLIIVPTQSPVVKIPSDTESVGSTAIQGCVSASEIELDIRNDHFNASNGVLYTRGFLKCIAVVGGRETVEIHEDCEEIGSYAMYGCSKAKTIRIKGDKIHSIGSYGFYGCVGFTNLDLKNVVTINKFAFAKTENLINVTFSGNKIKQIHMYAFAYSSIKYIYLSKSIELVDFEAFGPSGLEIFDFPIDSSITSLGGSFRLASNLKSIRISSNIASIAGTCFVGCNSLESVDFSYASSLTSIGDSAFTATSIRELVFNPRIEVLDNSAFKSCKRLSKITFPPECQIYSIKGSCFAYCSSLADFEVPEKITSLDPSVLEGCTSLRNITLNKNNHNFKVEGGILYDNGWNIALYPGGKAVGYLSPNTAGILPNVFYKQFILSSLTFSDEITSIKNIKSSTFYECERLAEVVFPTVVESIDKSWAVLCLLIERIVFPVNCRLTSFSDSQFDGFSSLRSVEFGHDGALTSISVECFANCESLVSVLVPDGVKHIKARAFEQCSNLARIEFVKGTKGKGADSISVEEKSFFGCSKLSEFDFRRVVSVGEMGFQGSGVQTVNFTCDVEKIGNSAFAGCSNLTFVSYCGTVSVDGDGFDLSTFANVRFIFGGRFSNCLLIKSIDGSCIFHPSPTFAQVCLPSIGVFSIVEMADSSE